MNTHLFADVSTAHLPDYERESVSAVHCIRVIDHDYGYWVNVPTDDLSGRLGELADEGFPVLAHLVETAANLGCWWINLDRDAPAHPRLPTFEE